MFKLRDAKNKATSFLGSYEQKDPAMLAGAEQAVGGLLIIDGLVGIDNPFGGKKRPGIFGSFFGILIGLAFILFGGTLFNFTGTQSLTADANGQVVSIGPPNVDTSTDSDGNTSTSTTCSMSVAYTVGATDYEQSTKSQSSDNCRETVGSSISIKYNPDKPGEFDTAATVSTVNNIKKIMPIVGLLLALTSLITFCIRLLSIIFGWKILRHGRNLAKTLPNGEGIGSQISQIREEFKKTFFTGGGAVSAIEGIIDSNNIHQPTSTAPVTSQQATPQTQVVSPAQNQPVAIAQDPQQVVQAPTSQPEAPTEQRPPTTPNQS